MKPIYRIEIRDRFSLGAVTVTAKGIRGKIGTIDCNTRNNFITYFCVENPKYRHKGIGKALFCHLVSCMEKYGVSEIFVIPQPEPEIKGYVSKEELKAMYQALGFELEKSDYDGSGFENDLYVYHIK